MSIDRTRHERTTARTAAIRIGILIAIVAVVAFGAYRLGWLDYRSALGHVEAMRQRHSETSVAMLFAAMIALFTALGAPATPFTVVAGALFGLVEGSIVAWVGAMVGAVAGYWIARTVGRGAISRTIEKRRRVRVALEKTHDFHGMLGLRLVPVLPIGVVNFVAGLARAPFGAYLAATAIGVLPTTVIFCYFADALVVSGSGGKAEATRAVLISSALVAALAFASKMMRSRSS